jgi:2-phospho-L-lactate guanylyltransferase
MDAGILPVKHLDRAKERLRNRYGPQERMAIARALLSDALSLCTSVPWLRWWVVTGDRRVADEARGHRLEVVPDDGRGLNAALRKAIATVLAAGARSVTIVPSDVPLAYVGDLRDLTDTGATSDVVLVPSHGDGGTNGLFLSPPDLFEPHFGAGSLKSHIDAAAGAGARCSILDLPRLALDIDTPDDVDDFLARPAHGESHTRTVLQHLARRVPR